MNVRVVALPDCPNAPAARAALRRALEDAGLEPNFEEVDVTAEGTPAPLRDWGSPTILVDGVDVGGRSDPTGPGCRLYRDASGRMSGVPSDDMLLAALRHAKAGR